MSVEPYRPPAEAFAVEERKELRRHPLVAALLSLIVPGAGQLYTGRPALGLGVWASLAACMSILRSGLLADRPWQFLALLAIVLLLVLSFLVEATVVSFRRRRIPRRLLARWIVLGPVLALLYLAQEGLQRSAPLHWADVPTQSMTPAVIAGERVLINPTRYREHRPQRGDIVVFPSPLNGGLLLQRVVALGGEQVEMRGWRAVIDGDAELDRWSFPSGLPAPEAGVSAEVPEGQLFLLGDRRDNSRDSRVFGWISEEVLLGSAESIVFSPDRDRIGQRIE